MFPHYACRLVNKEIFFFQQYRATIMIMLPPEIEISCDRCMGTTQMFSSSTLQWFTNWNIESSQKLMHSWGYMQRVVGELCIRRTRCSWVAPQGEVNPSRPKTCWPLPQLGGVIISDINNTVMSMETAGNVWQAELLYCWKFNVNNKKCSLK